MQDSTISKNKLFQLYSLFFQVAKGMFFDLVRGPLEPFGCQPPGVPVWASGSTTGQLAKGTFADLLSFSNSISEQVSGEIIHT